MGAKGETGNYQGQQGSSSGDQGCLNKIWCQKMLNYSTCENFYLLVRLQGR